MPLPKGDEDRPKGDSPRLSSMLELCSRSCQRMVASRSSLGDAVWGCRAAREGAARPAPRCILKCSSANRACFQLSIEGALEGGSRPVREGGSLALPKAGAGGLPPGLARL